MEIKLGCHVRMTGTNKYLIGSVNDALSYGANTFMIFLGAPHNTRRTGFEKLNIKEFHNTLNENNISLDDLVVHLPYIINMANTINPDTFTFSVDFLEKEIELAAKIGIKNLVLHPGSKLTGDLDESLKQLTNGINEVIKRTKDINSIICLETMAGKGNEVGINFDQMKTIISGVEDKSRIGVCFDTCHLHDAGYDMSKFDDVLDEFDKKVGIDYLKVIHLNDSKNEMSAHKDRHDNIGYGKIGFLNLVNIIYNKRVENVPKILETPYIGDRCVYKEEIEMLKNKTFKEL